MKTPFYIEEHPKLVKDYRDDIPGDSYSNKFPFFYMDTRNYEGIVIHHSAGPIDQDIDDIAWYHINARKWAGIGYHFVIKADGTIYYVGDLGTGRAHVAGLNHKYLGVCLVGCFMGEDEPTKAQLESTHLLCKEFIDVEKVRFPKIDSWVDIEPHRDLSPTACPGTTIPNWWKFIINGFPEDWKEKAEEFEKKYNSCKTSYSDIKKTLLKTENVLETAKEILNEMEGSNNYLKSENRDLLTKVRKIPEYRDTIKVLNAEIRRLRAWHFTFVESLTFLVRSLLGGVRNDKENNS